MTPAETASATAKAADFLMLQYGLAGIVMCALAVAVVMLWKQNNALNKTIADLTERTIKAIERQTATGETLIAMRDKGAAMSEQSTQGIMALVSMTQREGERTRESLGRLEKSNEATAKSCDDMVSAILNNRRDRG